MTEINQKKLKINSCKNTILIKISQINSSERKCFKMCNGKWLYYPNDSENTHPLKKLCLTIDLGRWWQLLPFKTRRTRRRNNQVWNRIREVQIRPSTTEVMGERTHRRGWERIRARKYQGTGYHICEHIPETSERSFGKLEKLFWIILLTTNSRSQMSYRRLTENYWWEYTNINTKLLTMGGTKKKYRVMPLQNMKSIPPAVLYELCRVIFFKLIN